jgi:hypothetical protein
MSLQIPPPRLRQKVISTLVGKIGVNIAGCAVEFVKQKVDLRNQNKNPEMDWFEMGWCTEARLLVPQRLNWIQP